MQVDGSKRAGFVSISTLFGGIMSFMTATTASANLPQGESPESYVGRLEQICEIECRTPPDLRLLVRENAKDTALEVAVIANVAAVQVFRHYEIHTFNFPDADCIIIWFDKDVAFDLLNPPSMEPIASNRPSEPEEGIIVERDRDRKRVEPSRLALDRLLRDRLIAVRGMATTERFEGVHVSRSSSVRQVYVHVRSADDLIIIPRELLPNDR